jgi:hypothetical protein
MSPKHAQWVAHTKSILSGLWSALKAAMSPKRGSSGAWGTTLAGKFVVDAMAGFRWLAMVLRREREEEEFVEGLEGDMFQDEQWQVYIQNTAS